MELKIFKKFTRKTTLEVGSNYPMFPFLCALPQQ